MTEEWLTYREIGARLGLNVEAARTRVRRAGWRTQPGNDGRTRVLVPDRAFVEPVIEDDGRVNDGINRTADLTGLVTLLTASEARIGRLERQIEVERDRVNSARTEADRLRAEVVSLTARADRAEQALTTAETEVREAREAAAARDDEIGTLRDVADGLRSTVARTEDRAVRAETRGDEAEARALSAEADAAEQRSAADKARVVAQEAVEELHRKVEAAQIAQAEAEADTAELRQAEAERRGRGRWARLKRAWRGAD
jgi:chromosome segregation protein